MFCEVELRGAPHTGQLVVPRNAVYDGHVYVLDAENRLRRRPVGVRSIQGSAAWLEDGLEEGERVVVSDPTPAIEGMLIKPVDASHTLELLIAEVGGDAPVE